MSFSIKQIKSLKNNLAGVSLIELIVAVAIFVIMIFSATTIFQMVFEAQRNAVNSQATQESMRYVMEVFSKELRSAKKNESGAVRCDVPTGMIFSTSTNAYGEILNFRNYKPDPDIICVKYYLNGENLMVSRDGVVATATPHTVKVSGLKFDLDQWSVSEQKQSKMTFKMDVEIKDQVKNNQKMKLQTTISSRNYE